MRRPADRLVAHWAKAATPPPRLTVSQWADAHRRLSETSAVKGGRWRTDATPYLRGIMDAVHDPGTKQIAVMKAVQIGGSEALANVLAYFIQYDPCSMLYILPTFGDAEDWSKRRLAPMIRSTPALRAVVRTKRATRGSQDAESTVHLKMFPGGNLVIAGANTPNTYAAREARVVFMDDVDRIPPVIGDEGDPAVLARNRTTTFHDGLVVYVSTPVLKGGRIDGFYQRSDRRRFFLRCPACGRQDWTTWGDPAHFSVVYEGHDPESARLACPAAGYGGCGARLTEVDRRGMVQTGDWRPTATPEEAGLVGFHAPAMIGTLGVTLESLVERWLTARAGGKEKLKPFVQTVLAEGWEDYTERVPAHVLMDRREACYAEGFDMPAAAVLVTAGVDVQLTRFEVQVQAWAPTGERWVVGWDTVPGDPTRSETRDALREYLKKLYRHPSGHLLPIALTCVDTGWATQEMYRFVERYQDTTDGVHRRFVRATKGQGGKIGMPLVGQYSEASPSSGRSVRLWFINTDEAKADVMAAATKEEVGPNYLHFHASLEAPYFDQLTAEHKETRHRAGQPASISWVLDRDRNEALDTAVLCLAAYRMIAANSATLAEYIRRLDAPPPVPGAALKPPAAAPQARRVVRSGYLG